MADTKQFVNVNYIKDGVILLKNGGMRAVVLVSSMNFELKSDVEKQAIVDAYQAFLNSLDYPIQVLINSRQINLDDYLVDLKSLYDKQENELLKLQIGEYLSFVNSLIEISNVISKSFYVVVPYNPTKSATSLISKTPTHTDYSDAQFEEYATQLWQRVKQVRIGLIGLGLHAEILNTKETVELMYNFYNPAAKSKKIGALYGGGDAQNSSK